MTTYVFNPELDDNKRCDICGKPIKDGQSAWISARLDYKGEMVQSGMWCEVHGVDPADRVPYV